MDPYSNSNRSLSKHFLRITSDCTPFVYFDTIRYTIFFIKHSGNLLLNFQSVRTNGYRALAMCPGEVLIIKGHQKLTGFSFDQCKYRIDVEQFKIVFGSSLKLFEIQSEKLLEKILLNGISLVVKPQIGNPIKKDILNIFSLLKLREISAEEEKAYHFVTLVHCNYKMHHRMDYYAKALGTTPKNLSTIFLKIGSGNPHSFIRNRIAQEAKRLLVFTDKAVNSVCYEVGFNDPAYFSRFFKNNTAKTAIEFRNDWRSMLLNMKIQY